MKTQKIGKVTINSLTKNQKNLYLDSGEQFLLDFFDKPQSQKLGEIKKILANSPDWPTEYHLSPQREFILSWYPFKKNSTAIEIGAGCGAVTGMLTKKLKKVYANELSPIRAKIIAKRFSDSPNLEVYEGNLLEMKKVEQTDYVVVIGVLEYSGKYIEAPLDERYYKPFLSFLTKVKSLLKPNGHVLLAIENKLGTKYLAGGAEDHYASYFESVQEYPHYNGARTFSKNELHDLFADAGFKDINFYFPYPDYKLPESVFSEDGFKSIDIPLSTFTKVIDRSNQRFEIFDEVAFSHALNKESLLPQFANSFLVDASI